MGDDLHFDDGSDFYHTIIVFQAAYVVGGPISRRVPIFHSVLPICLLTKIVAY